MNILVAGGTGFLGRHIVAALTAAGHEVAVLGRDPSRIARIPELKGVRAVRGDVTNPPSLRGSMEGVDAVVGAVQFPGHPVEVPRKDLTYDVYDRQGTQNLVDEAVAAGVGRFVYLSGAGADLTSDKTWYRAKGAAERYLRDSGLLWTIVRPSWAYGPEDKALNKFELLSRFSPFVPRLGLRPQRVQPVYCGDIAAAFERIFATEGSWGNVFEIGGPDIMTMEEIIVTLLDVLGRRRWVVPVPTWMAKLGTAPLVMLPKPPMSPQGIEFAVQDGLVDTSAVRETLGIDPIPLEEGLRRYLKR
jgi:uncharacterized protein YbjT (DUF2867 family)